MSPGVFCVAFPKRSERCSLDFGSSYSGRAIFLPVMFLRCKQRAIKLSRHADMLSNQTLSWHDKGSTWRYSVSRCGFLTIITPPVSTFLILPFLWSMGELIEDCIVLPFIFAKPGDKLILKCFDENNLTKIFWYKQCLGEKPRLISTEKNATIQMRKANVSLLWTLKPAEMT